MHKLTFFVVIVVISSCNAALQWWRSPLNYKIQPTTAATNISAPLLIYTARER